MKKFFLIIGVMWFAQISFAQLTSDSAYFCDFEDAAEVAQWTFNAGSRGQSGPNKWYVGPAGSFGLNSTKGMYVSCGPDTTKSNYTTAQSGFVVAYREMTLKKGTYNIIFDWIGQGNTDDCIYVCWVDATQTTASNWGTKQLISPPSFLPKNPIKCNGRSAWGSSSGTFTATGNPGKLVIVWYNALGTPFLPAGAIDNINISKQAPATKPSSLVYTPQTGTLSWTGKATEYDVLVFNGQTKASSSFPAHRGTSIPMPQLTDEGMYYFYVRSRGENDSYSEWVSTSKFVWIPGKRCIDFLDLTPDNSGKAKCFNGGWEESYSGPGITEHLKDRQGQIDMGYDNENSLHTIQYIPGDTDPRTGGQLKTIPDDEIASVRLGGLWDKTGNMTSTIEYEYDVQAGSSDLLILQYACVLEYVDYHPEEVEPRFKLEILDTQGHPIDDCSQADFKAGFGDTKTWHKYQYNSCDVRWCDWTRVTVSLRNYIGNRLTIRLTSYSCAQSAHFGYTYFTINCAAGDLQGIACGDFSTDHFDAPEGFDYRWYKADDPTRRTLATTRHFDIPSTDASVYLVDIISKIHSDCWYTLEANPNPRFPKVDVTPVSAAADCENKVVFMNNSGVIRINRETYDTIPSPKDRLDFLSWDFGDGSPVVANDTSDVVKHTYDMPEGGQVTVTCIASMSNGACKDTSVFTVMLPDLRLSGKDTTVHICGDEDTDSHGLVHYAADGDYTDTVAQIVNQYGCTAWQLRYVKFHPTFDTTYVERICEGGEYVWPVDKKAYVRDTVIALNYQTVHGCDSILRLQLTVDPALKLALPDTTYVCPDDGVIEFKYEVLGGSLDSIVFLFPEAAQRQGFLPRYAFANGEQVLIATPEGVRPDNYMPTIEYVSERCPHDPDTVCIQTQYPTSLVMQKDGFIAVKNSDYNGGYSFSSFVWYRNGEQLQGIGESYIPVADSDTGIVYTIELLREGENTPFMTCPIVYTAGTELRLMEADVLVWPTVVSPGMPISISGAMNCTVYTALGNEVAHYTASDRTYRTITVPAQTGIYILHFENNRNVRIIVQ